VGAVELDAIPPLLEEEHAALIAAIERAGIELDGAPSAYESAWRAAGLAEATGGEEDGYTLSPRSTRGATRA
jgi:hypothetical protein